MKNLSLGSSIEVLGTAIALDPKEEKTIEEKLSSLERKINMLAMDFAEQNIVHRDLLVQGNMDGIPVGTTLMGTSSKGGVKTLIVQPDGYYLEGTRFESLSAAAEATSGVRRSGWTFWRLPDGRTAKDVFGR